MKNMTPIKATENLLALRRGSILETKRTIRNSNRTRYVLAATGQSIYMLVNLRTGRFYSKPTGVGQLTSKLLRGQASREELRGKRVRELVEADLKQLLGPLYGHWFYIVKQPKEES